ncbi:MAG: zf-HC2 domain-containing protein [Acidobacteria bacterium]|nr:zf-HC2 domain-containing protein [Acidobacteriota bacterium]
MFSNHVNKNLSAYLHGELTAEDAQRVVDHLRMCAGCRAEFEEIEFGAQLAGQLQRQQAPESLWVELEAAINREDFVQRRDAKNAETPQRNLGLSWLTLKLCLELAPVVILIGLGIVFLNRYFQQPPPNNRPSWEVTRLDGQPVIGRKKIAEKGSLPVGEWLTTDDASRAQISVGQIGEVKVEPNSRIQLLEAQDDNHRLAMQRGKMEAFIWAPPRKFFVQTPSALAVDLGCSYTLEVAEDGTSLLNVTMGWVAFEWQGRESFVPAEAKCVTRPKLGPGTPYFGDASTEFQLALAQFDTGQADSLRAVLAQARKRDALTLWHLLARTEGEARGKVFDRLAELIPPPKNVTREGVLSGDRAMLDAWWAELGLGDTEWWRMWKGALPTQTK